MTMALACCQGDGTGFLIDAIVISPLIRGFRMSGRNVSPAEAGSGFYNSPYPGLTPWANFSVALSGSGIAKVSLIRDGKSWQEDT
jgi:hypothetical protein